MGKDKVKRFKENLTFKNLIQPEFEEIFVRNTKLQKNHTLKGQWNKAFFKNENPITLELGCGRGEYTVNMGAMFPERNFIGIDIKGARMWRGAKTATENEMDNVGFLRTRIEFINSFFDAQEIDQIWITFPDPQLKIERVKKRLTSPIFLAYYARFLKQHGQIHLKTDSLHLHQYTRAVIEVNGLLEQEVCEDIYGDGLSSEVLSIKTAYEKSFLDEGLKITYLRFGLGEASEFIDPNFEPDNLL